MHRFDTKADKIFVAIVYIILGIVAFLVLYPLYFVIIASISDPKEIAAGAVVLLPKGFNAEGYITVFKDPSIMTGYANSIYYSSLGTLVSVLVTLFIAYPLSRKEFMGRGFIMFLFTVTMFFGGGMIPTFITVRNYGLINKVWALVLPGAAGVFNVIIARTFIQTTIPNELKEAADMDGCNNFYFFFRILVPLAKPIIAVLALNALVRHWNSYLPPLLYMRDDSRYPLQVVLRSILIQHEANDIALDAESLMSQYELAEKLKYSLIIVASIPVLCIYPFIQKYLVKGMMLGSIKG